jgi:hypothetical protein
MKVYCAGAESSEYQKVLLILKADSLQTFMAQASIEKMKALSSSSELALGISSPISNQPTKGKQP